MMRVLALMIVGLALSTLPGCGLFQRPPAEVIVVDTACQLFKPIYLERGDADVMSGTAVKSILTHNEVGFHRCGWGTAEDEDEEKPLG